MIGRRIPAQDGKLPPGFEILDERWLPGDYCGPLLGYTGSVPCVMYRLPDGDFGHVTAPPHTFRECADGSLEIRNSILHQRVDGDQEHVWHGYLNCGHHWDDSATAEA